MTLYINFLAWMQRIINLAACFAIANNVIHPRPPIMPICNQEMPPGLTPDICLRHNFVFIYISTLENWADTSLNQNFQNIVLNSHANFRDTSKLSKALTARPQKPRPSWILEQIFPDGCCPTCMRTLGRKHAGEFVSFCLSDSKNMLNIS